MKFFSAEIFFKEFCFAQPAVLDSCLHIKPSLDSCLHSILLEHVCLHRLLVKNASLSKPCVQSTLWRCGRLDFSSSLLLDGQSLLVQIFVLNIFSWCWCAEAVRAIGNVAMRSPENQLKFAAADGPRLLVQFVETLSVCCVASSSSSSSSSNPSHGCYYY